MYIYCFSANVNNTNKSSLVNMGRACICVISHSLSLILLLFKAYTNIRSIKCRFRKCVQRAEAQLFRHPS